MSENIEQHVSFELKLKKELMMQYRGLFDPIQSKVISAAGGKSYNELRKIQACVKQALRINTKRVNWRTRDGILLWFCENWSQIAPFLETLKSQPSKASSQINSLSEVSSQMKDYQINLAEDYFCSFIDDDSQCEVMTPEVTEAVNV